MELNKGLEIKEFLITTIAYVSIPAPTRAMKSFLRSCMANFLPGLDPGFQPADGPCFEMCGDKVDDDLHKVDICVPVKPM